MYRILFITAASLKEARMIARELVEKKLAACVNIVRGVESIFRWKGKLDCAKEVLLIVKSKKSKVPAIMTLVRAVHSYDCPEIIALGIREGNKAYLEWIDESLR